MFKELNFSPYYRVKKKMGLLGMDGLPESISHPQLEGRVPCLQPEMKILQRVFRKRLFCKLGCAISKTS